MPYQRMAKVVLEEWRSVERHLAGAEAGSAESALFQAAADVLRDEYERFITEAIVHRRPVPPPFPSL
jgi:hypothetical protein